MKNCKEKNSKIELFSANSPLLNKKRKNDTQYLINKNSYENAQKKVMYFEFMKTMKKIPCYPKTKI